MFTMATWNANLKNGDEPTNSIISLLLLIGRFQSIKTGVLLIFSFITGDKIEFLPPIMFLNEYITGS